MTTPARPNVFGTILWAADGSTPSDAAHDYVRDTCESRGSTLRIVHVARPLGGAEGERRIAKLKATTSSLRRRGVDASLHVVRGAIRSPADQIAAVARMVDADLVLVSARGRSPAVGALAGSVTQRLLTEAPCPVLIFPAPTTPAATRRSA